MASLDSGSTTWTDLADQVLAGHRLTEEEGLAVLRSSDDELLDLLAAVYRVRRHFAGKKVRLSFLMNAKSGQCCEDCGYCSQSSVSKAEIPVYNIVAPEQILDGARVAAERKAKTYCTVISGRRPGEKELAVFCDIARQIKATHRLKICVSPGFLTAEESRRLKEAGVDRVNHNLNTSERFYPEICTTHTYAQRLETLESVRDAGMEICSGGIVGMGEEDADVVELARRLAELGVEIVPVNFLLPIPGTKLEGTSRLTPHYCLKVLSLFRLANPRCELRIAAGREKHLGPLQPLGLYAADGIFVGDYLTTRGQPPSADYEMIEAMGFEVAEEE